MLLSFPFNLWNMCLCVCMSLSVSVLSVCVCVGVWLCCCRAAWRLQGALGDLCGADFKRDKQEKHHRLGKHASHPSHIHCDRIHACRKKTRILYMQVWSSGLCLCSRSALGPCGIPPRMIWRALFPKSWLCNRCTHPQRETHPQSDNPDHFNYFHNI